jgi:hypothetical protein
VPFREAITIVRKGLDKKGLDKKAMAAVTALSHAGRVRS